MCWYYLTFTWDLLLYIWWFGDREAGSSVWPAGAHSGVEYCQPPQHYHLITHAGTGVSCHLRLAIAPPGVATGTAMGCWCPNTVPPADDLRTQPDITGRSVFGSKLITETKLPPSCYKRATSTHLSMETIQNTLRNYITGHHQGKAEMQVIFS